MDSVIKLSKTYVYTEDRLFVYSHILYLREGDGVDVILRVIP